MNNMTTPKTFEEKMKDRIKDSIGDLISDEDLKKLVEKGVQEAFFTERTAQQGYNSVRVPALMTGIVEECLKDRAKVAVQEWMVEHADEVAAILDKIVRDDLGQIMLAAFTQQLTAPLQQFQWSVQQQLSNLQNNIR
jgi:replicative superfamily II helicase